MTGAWIWQLKLTNIFSIGSEFNDWVYYMIQYFCLMFERKCQNEIFCEYHLQQLWTSSLYAENMEMYWLNEHKFILPRQEQKHTNFF